MALFPVWLIKIVALVVVTALTGNRIVGSPEQLVPCAEQRRTNAAIRAGWVLTHAAVRHDYRAGYSTVAVVFHL